MRPWGVQGGLQSGSSQALSTKVSFGRTGVSKVIEKVVSKNSEQAGPDNEASGFQEYVALGREQVSRAYTALTRGAKTVIPVRARSNRSAGRLLNRSNPISVIKPVPARITLARSGVGVPSIWN
jgi:hypothetical protein